VANIPVEPRQRSTGLLLIVVLVALVAALGIWYFTSRDDERPPGAERDVPAETRDAADDARDAAPLDGAADAASDAAGTVGDAVEDAAGAVGEVVEDAAGAVGETVEDATDGQ
jgi:hypothetical protein